MRSVFLFKEIPLQTISDPLPYATVCSNLGGRFRSPLCGHTLTRPSVPESKNLDSSENIIGVQYKSDISCQSFDTYLFYFEQCIFGFLNSLLVSRHDATGSVPAFLTVIRVRFPAGRNFNFYSVTVCVLSCVFTGGGRDILLTTYFRESRLCVCI